MNVERLCFAVFLCLFVSGAASLTCYSCPYSDSVDGCNQTTVCSTGEICMLRVLSNNTKREIYFETKCATPQVCEDAVLQYQGILASLLTGKRDIDSLVLEDLCLAQCCDEDFCNNGCRVTTLSSAVMDATSSSNVTSTDDPVSVSTTTTPVMSIHPNPAPVNIFTPAPVDTQTTLTSVMSQSGGLPVLSDTTASSLALASVTTVVPTSTDTAIAASASTDTTTTASILTDTTTTTSLSTDTTTAATTSTDTTTTASKSTDTTTTVYSLSSQPSHPSTTSGIKVPTRGSTQTSPQVSSVSNTIRIPTKPVSNTPVTSTASSTPVTSPLTTDKTTASLTSTMGKTTTTFIATTTLGVPKCPRGFEAFEASCYMFAKHEMTFAAAKEFCKSYGSYMVHVNTEKENNFIVSTLKQLDRGPVQYWLGINDDVIEGEWRYTDTGELTTYSDWAPNEPDNTHGLDGNVNTANCAVISPRDDFRWVDEGCSIYQTGQAICEKRSPSPP